MAAANSQDNSGRPREGNAGFGSERQRRFWPRQVFHLEIMTDAHKLVHLIPQTNQVVALHTIIRDKHTKRADFIFYSDRLIRLLIEEGLGALPFKEKKIETPCGIYNGTCPFVSAHSRPICSSTTVDISGV